MVKRAATISRGCILAAGVVIGEGVVVPPFTRLTTLLDAKEDDGFDSDSSEEDGGRADQSKTGAKGTPAWDVHIVGKDGKGKEWKVQEEENDDDDDEDEEEEDANFGDTAKNKELVKRLLSARGTDIGAVEEVG